MQQRRKLYDSGRELSRFVSATIERSKQVLPGGGGWGRFCFQSDPQLTATLSVTLYRTNSIAKAKHLALTVGHRCTVNHVLATSDSRV